MSAYKTGNLFCCLLILLGSSCSPGIEKSYTGLIVYKEFDTTRTFDTTGSMQSPNYYRPVKIDVYFPSVNPPSTPAMFYGDILDMYEQRVNYNIPPDSCRKMSMAIAESIAEYLKLDDPAKILDYQTGIYKDLSLPAEKLPLIIYAAGMNGSSWENTILFDSLTKVGYVVAAISSVGKFPGYMTAAEDLDEQVRDIMYVKRKMKALPFIDGAKIGLLSWSMGGSAATKAAMLSNDFKCLLSFDGTEIHYYGTDTTRDRQFDALKKIPPYIPERISIPYMYLSSERTSSRDSVYFFPEYINSKEKFYLQFKGAVHESFSSIIPIVKAFHPQIKSPPIHHNELISGLTIHFFDQYLCMKKTISVAAEISSIVRKDPAQFTLDYAGNTIAE